MTENEFKEIFHSKYSSFCNYALAIIKDEAAAEDVVQEVFIDFWKRHAGKEIGFKIEHYILRAVKFRCIDHLRKMSRNRTVSGEIPDLQEEGSDGKEQEGAVELQTVINLAIDQLPPKTREVFVLSKIDKIPYKEIAARMNISEKTVENQMSRAFRHLREKLKDFRFYSVILFCLFG